MKRARPTKSTLQQPHPKKHRSKSHIIDPDQLYPILRYSNLQITTQQISQFLQSLASPHTQSAQQLQDNTQTYMCLVPVQYYRRSLQRIWMYINREVDQEQYYIRDNKEIGEQTAVRNQWEMDIQV